MSGTCIDIETRASVRHVRDMHQPRDIQASMRAIVILVWDTASASIAAKVAHGSSPTSEKPVTLSFEALGITQGRVPRPCVTQGQPHGRVVRPCVPNLQVSVHSSKHMGRDTATASGHGCAWACHGRVRDTGYGHRRALGCVKTLVGSNLEFNSHGLGAWACPFMLRQYEPHGPSTQPSQKGHMGVLPFHMSVCP
ncbi:Catalase-peroxidase [Gossypium arboreum]|uniref:Catalase-peroxidase n=1 Tax=Gossypium arboreum TaxID=29729 RepID=A0A0B0MDX4_GOSAR|nr:Catalase-peroxidase [Gossypium arboreum]